MCVAEVFLLVQLEPVDTGLIYSDLHLLTILPSRIRTNGIPANSIIPAVSYFNHNDIQGRSHTKSQIA